MIAALFSLPAPSADADEKQDAREPAEEQSESASAEQ
jgi:hypothetical protein